MRQIRTVVWDVLAWLPVDPAAGNHAAGTALSGGNDCWHSVFSQPLVAQLLLDILMRPADLVMSQLRRHER